MEHIRCRNKAKSIKRKYKRNAHGLTFNDKNNKEIWSILNKNGVVSNTVNFENNDPNILNDVFSYNQTIDNNHLWILIFRIMDFLFVLWTF